MKTYRLAGTDLEVSRLGYGCGALASLGSPKPPSAADGAKAIASFKAAHDKAATARWRDQPLSAEIVKRATAMIAATREQGITLFDHADVYGLGRAEQLFGAVLREIPGLRDEIVIQTKCGVHFAADRYRPEPGDPHCLDLSADHILRSAEGSLRRLGTDRLDLLLLHRPDALAQPEEIASAFDTLHQAGKVRYFGVSNHTPMQIELLKRHIRQPLVVNQVQIGLEHSQLISDGLDFNRDDATRISHGYLGVGGTLDYCRLNDIRIQAWAPLKGGNMLDPPRLLDPPADAPPEVLEAAALIRRLADKYDATPSAIALAWLLRHPVGIVPITGSTNAERVVQACAADRIELDREEYYELLVAAAGVTSHRLLGLVLPEGY